MTMVNSGLGGLIGRYMLFVNYIVIYINVLKKHRYVKITNCSLTHTAVAHDFGEGNVF